ncbi:hypothetical protein LEP1GSC059_3975 [Leptospira noguchii serovar Panama str. CZ214]|uniref:Uncharacterized protein n=1 Tax=Leptospira noguchii serovar Panama str. CZ214 TaxID=1001595 RepID=T0GXP7_9LEPT|nr:hypothetical protein LEP1GSC059_3975 [Leptospira noguchii serovar Panama str. CZ214]
MINGLNHSFSPNYNCILLENFKLFHIHKLLSIGKDHLKRIWNLYQNQFFYHKFMILESVLN